MYRGAGCSTVTLHKPLRAITNNVKYSKVNSRAIVNRVFKLMAYGTVDNILVQMCEGEGQSTL